MHIRRVALIVHAANTSKKIRAVIEAKLRHNIAVQSSIQREPMTIDEITEYLNSFKGLDYTIEKYKKRLIHLFIRKVILYNDKCRVFFNFTDRAEAVLTLDDSLESERTSPTSVGDGSIPFAVADKSNISANIANEPEHTSNVFEFINFGA